MDYIKEYDNIMDFYRESVTFDEKEGNRELWEKHMTEDNPRFKGLSLEEAEASKWVYKKGLSELNELDINTVLGGSKTNYRWSETDGDDIEYDRLLSGLPALKQRVRKAGIGTGKIIELIVNIAENCGVTAEKMMLKAYTAVQISDYLEKNGYRVAIYVVENTRNAGSYKGSPCNLYQVKTCIKRSEEPLLKGMLLTCISPWFFRIHCFRHETAKIKATYGLGRAESLNKKSTKETIIIDSGECLDKRSVENKLKQIEKLFEEE